MQSIITFIYIMGQFLDYIASVFTHNKISENENKSDKTNNHVTFSDNSFTQVFSRGAGSEAKARIASLSKSNRQTILLYLVIGALSFLIHWYVVTLPKIQRESFDITQPEGWQLITLNLVPLVVYVAAIGAMLEINKPISEGTKLTSKNSGLDFKNNDFIFALKVIILIVAVIEISSIFSDHYLWIVMMIVPVWCFKLTTKVAQAEYKRHAPSPKKQWVKLGTPKSPSSLSPKKEGQQSASKQAQQVRATPRTRTKRAVKSIITGVSDKYHAFEQNVAHQLSQKIFTPLSPKLRMIE